MAVEKKATLILDDGRNIELPILSGTLGEDVLDVRTLGSKGLFTYDPGYLSTASCESQITFIDGNEGILLHRGFPIAQLAKQSTYLEVCYILLYGETPSAEQFATFKDIVTRHTMIHEQITRLFQGFRRDSPHGSAVRCDRRAGGVLSRFFRRSQRTPSRNYRLPAAVQNAHRGRYVLQILCWSAVYVPAQ